MRGRRGRVELGRERGGGGGFFVVIAELCERASVARVMSESCLQCYTAKKSISGSAACLKPACAHKRPRRHARRKTYARPPTHTQTQ